MSQKKISTEEIVQRFIEKHGVKYNYDRVIYNDYRGKVSIGCQVHGYFEQSVSNHMSGYGCTKCKMDYLVSLRTLTTEKFIAKAKEVHGDRYGYEKVEYVHNRKPVIVTCKIHGDFFHEPHTHLQGRNCIKCKYEHMGDLLRLSREEFLRRANDVHLNKYSYDKAVYTGMNKAITITCPVHGDFERAALSHVSGSGCYSCTSSRGESVIETILNKASIKFIREYIVPNVKPSFRYDFFLLDLNIFIEFHGIQHFKYIPFFHKTGIGDLKRRQLTDAIKKDVARTINVGYLQFDYLQLAHLPPEDFELLVSQKILKLCDVNK